MIEPLDDELRAHVGAFQAVERPSAAARAATWAAIEARTGGDVIPLRPARARVSWALAAVAAALVLSLGLAAATAWRDRPDPHVEAIHQTTHRPAPAVAEPRTGESRDESPQPVPAGRSAESPQPAGTDSVRSPDAFDPSLRPVPADSAPSAGESPQPAPADSAPSSAESPQPAPDTSKSRSDSTARRRPQTSDTPSLRPEEVASFQRAQAALADERYDDALRALDAHGRRFAGGLFEEERLVSRAAALCKLGRLAEAEGARRRFLRERPTSHLAERMRQICRPIE